MKLVNLILALITTITFVCLIFTAETERQLWFGVVSILLSAIFLLAFRVEERDEEIKNLRGF